MTENDYIAEYVKERYPQLLNIDFAMWKAGRTVGEAMRSVGEAIAEIMEQMEEER